MATVVRLCGPGDAPRYLELLKASLGEDYPDKQVYDPVWSTGHFGPGSEFETWVVETDGCLMASISFLPPLLNNANPIGNLGRFFARAESSTNGSAEALLKKVTDVAEERRQHCVTRVFAGMRPASVIRKPGLCLCGLPASQAYESRSPGVLFYVRPTNPELLARLPLSDSLPQIKELSTVVLANLKIPNPISIQDGTIVTRCRRR